MEFLEEKKKILIIDFGSQVTKLIARRIRDLGVYSVVITPFEIKNIKSFNFIKGIILSGGPSSVTKHTFQSIPKSIFLKRIPILGICYGLQLISKLNGGKIKSSKKEENLEELIFLKKKIHY